MATYKNTDKIISHLNDEIEACGNPDSDNEPIAYGTKLGLLSAKAFIETAETVDVEEVRHGKWIPSKVEAIKTIFICSECNREVDMTNDYFGKPSIHVGKHYPYCHCGALMDGEE